MSAVFEGPDFAARGIELQFLKSRPFEYGQFGAAFVPWLSIVDVLMFNPLEVVRATASGTSSSDDLAGRPDVPWQKLGKVFTRKTYGVAAG